MCGRNWAGFHPSSDRGDPARRTKARQVTWRRNFAQLDDKHRDFIGRQHIFFTASAAPDTRVNVSPRSTDTFRILGPNSVAYLDRTGSGNETSAHVKAGGRMTIMFCAFEGPPMILRLHGKGRILHRGSPDYARMLADSFDGTEPPGARQIVVLDADLVVTSCGYGVPFFEYKRERPSLDNWANAKSEAELVAYRQQKNRVSLDGLPTGLPEEEAATAAE